MSNIIVIKQIILKSYFRLFALQIYVTKPRLSRDIVIFFRANNEILPHHKPNSVLGFFEFFFMGGEFIQNMINILKL